jgi:hypothetical protein
MLHETDYLYLAFIVRYQGQLPVIYRTSSCYSYSKHTSCGCATKLFQTDETVSRAAHWHALRPDFT